MAWKEELQQEVRAKYDLGKGDGNDDGMQTAQVQLEHELEKHKVDRMTAGEMQEESTLHSEDGRIRSDYNIQEESTLCVEALKLQLERKFE